MTALTHADQNLYRKQLLALIDRLKGVAARLESEIRLPTGAEAMVSQNLSDGPLQTSTEGDEEVAQATLMNEEQLLTESRAALARLDDGTFGHCERCGRRIGKTRLDAVPYARQCMHCARAGNLELP